MQEAGIRKPFTINVTESITVRDIANMDAEYMTIACIHGKAARERTGDSSRHNKSDAADTYTGALRQFIDQTTHRLQA